MPPADPAVIPTAVITGTAPAAAAPGASPVEDEDLDLSAIGRPEADVPEPFLAAESRLAVVGIFFILLVGALGAARDFLLPVSLAFLFALVLSPAVRGLRRRGVPEVVSAAALVVILVIAIGSAVWFLIEPTQQLVNDAPRIAASLQEKIHVLRGPIEQMIAASERMQEATSSGSAVQRVTIQEGGYLAQVASGVPEIFAKTALTIVLLLFLLASGDMFYEKLVKVLPTLSDKKKGVRITREVEREVSRYLFTITLINIGLGIAIGIAMAVVGMPTPALWGILGGVLNYVPYIGAAVAAATVAAVALVSFDSLGQALLAPAVFYAITAFEGQIVTPMLVGRRLEMNPVAVFFAVAFWGWLWGIAGAIIAVPILVVIKIFADHTDRFNAVGEFLGARDNHAVRDKDAGG